VVRAEERGGAARRKRMRFGGLRTGLGPGIKLPLGKRKRVGTEKRGAGICVGIGVGVGVGVGVGA